MVAAKLARSSAVVLLHLLRARVRRDMSKMGRALHTLFLQLFVVAASMMMAASLAGVAAPTGPPPRCSAFLTPPPLASPPCCEGYDDCRQPSGLPWCPAAAAALPPLDVRNNPLSCLPQLAKPHYSWALPNQYLVNASAYGGVLLDYARITGSVPLGIDATATAVATAADACRRSGRQGGCSLAINYSPWMKWPSIARDPDPTICGAPEAAELASYRGALQNLTRWLAVANEEHTGVAVTVGAVIVDSETFGAIATAVLQCHVLGLLPRRISVQWIDRLWLHRGRLVVHQTRLVSGSGAEARAGLQPDTGVLPGQRNKWRRQWHGPGHILCVRRGRPLRASLQPGPTHRAAVGGPACNRPGLAAG